MEWIGIAMFVFGNTLWKQYSYEVFHMRCLLVVLVFMQLRDITFGLDRKRSLKRKVTVEKNTTVPIKMAEHTSTVKLMN
jgi:hypothetical protein